MIAKDALKILEKEVAPIKLSDDFCAKYKMYDNSGIIIDHGGEIKAILFSLDLSEDAVKAAIVKGCNLIVTHHPAIYGGISRFDLTADFKARALAACFKNGISVISMHLNFDAAPKGIDYYLMRGLGGKKCTALATVEGGEYGRAYEIEPMPLDEYINRIKEQFDTARIICHGENKPTMKKVASFCGAGLDDEAVAFCKREKVDIAVSSDLSHHRIEELVSCGITVLQLTHYCAENYGFNKIYTDIKDKFSVPSHYFKDGRFV